MICNFDVSISTERSPTAAVKLPSSRKASPAALATAFFATKGSCRARRSYLGSSRQITSSSPE